MLLITKAELTNGYISYHIHNHEQSIQWQLNQNKTQKPHCELVNLTKTQTENDQKNPQKKEKTRY